MRWEVYMFNKVTLEKALKDNIRNYQLDMLFDMDTVREEMESLSAVTNVGFLVTNRHGDKSIYVNWNGDKNVDVDANPGIKLRIAQRTMAHIYVDYSKVSKDIDATKKLIDAIIKGFEIDGQKSYELMEIKTYVDTVMGENGQDLTFNKDEKKDPLTGVLNKVYFDNRVKILDRSQIVPVADICININDWKFVNDNFGDDESDRLIKSVAEIVSAEAKTDYVIGRVDGDVFNVLISMPLDGEVEDFCDRVRTRCNNFKDDILAPSVAIGYAFKENVEQKLEECYSDAEYAMFENKIDVKNEDGYKARLEHGLNK